MEDELLIGERNEAEILSKIGTPFVGEAGELGYIAHGPEAIAKYETWVKKTWRVNELVQKWINTQLSMDSQKRSHQAPVIIPHGDTLCFRCESCGCEIEEGYIVNNTLRHSDTCRELK